MKPTWIGILDYNGNFSGQFDIVSMHKMNSDVPVTYSVSEESIRQAKCEPKLFDVAFLSSHCEVAVTSDREEYVHELMQSGISVHSFGKSYLVFTN